MSLSNTMKAAVLGIVQATASVPTTVTALGATLFGGAFATSAEAADSYGTFGQVRFKSGNEWIADLMSRRNSPDIIHDHINRVLKEGKYWEPGSPDMKWEESDIEKVINNTPLGALHKNLQGYTLGQVKDDTEAHRNYRGVCTKSTDDNLGRGGIYIPKVSDQAVIHISLLGDGKGGVRGTVRGMNSRGEHQQNYSGTSTSGKPATSRCDAREYKI